MGPYHFFPEGPSHLEGSNTNMSVWDIYIYICMYMYMIINVTLTSLVGLSFSILLVASIQMKTTNAIWFIHPTTGVMRILIMDRYG